MKPNTSPRGTSNETSLTARVVPKNRCRRRSSIMGWVMGEIRSFQSSVFSFRIDLLPSSADQVQAFFLLGACHAHRHVGGDVDEGKVGAGLEELPIGTSNLVNAS